jgi:hypothetical protein
MSAGEVLYGPLSHLWERVGVRVNLWLAVALTPTLSREREREQISSVEGELAC